MEQERTLALALCRVEGIGAVSIRKLLAVSYTHLTLPTNSRV